MINNAIFNFGHIVNGNIMEFSTDFEYSGWKHTKSPNKDLHSWYNQIEIVNNSNGFRCDDFIHTDKQKGKHILFAGCSVTWGDALPKEDTWGYMVYREILKKTPLGGYFNLGFPGSSIALQIFWMMKYFKKFGNPDYIFFLLPNLERFISVNSVEDDYGYHKPGSSMLNKKNNEYFSESLTLANYFSYELYSMLEQYCKTNGIKLISSSWSYSEDGHSNEENTTTLFDGQFDTFFQMDPRGISMPDWVYKYMQENKDATIKAIDGEHPGKAMQAFYTYRMLTKYEEINENSGI